MILYIPTKRHFQINPSLLGFEENQFLGYFWQKLAYHFNNN